MGFSPNLDLVTQRQRRRRGAVARNKTVFTHILDGGGYSPIEIDKNFIGQSVMPRSGAPE
jgi:hypothetical protein